MIVHRVVMPVTESVSWTVLGDDGAPVEPVESYLAICAALERSPNTQRAYATSLKLWFEFLGHVGVAWDEAGVEDVARFVAWLRAPADNVVVLDGGTAGAVAGDGEPPSRGGVRLLRPSRPLRVSVSRRSLVAWRRVGRGGYKPFLHHVTKGRPVADPADQAGRGRAGCRAR